MEFEMDGEAEVKQLTQFYNILAENNESLVLEQGREEARAI